jgi:hypothetical protein
LRWIIWCPIQSTVRWLHQRKAWRNAYYGTSIN